MAIKLAMEKPGDAIVQEAIKVLPYNPEHIREVCSVESAKNRFTILYSEIISLGSLK